MQLNLLHRPEALTSLKDDLASRPAGGITEPLGGEGLGRRNATRVEERTEI